MRPRAQLGHRSGTGKRPPLLRRLGRGGALLLLAVIAGSAGWLWQRAHSAPSAAIREALDPQERAIRESVAKAPADLEASRALGRYLLEHTRPYEAMWAFQDVLERRPDDAEARRGLARSLIVARLPQRALSVLAESPVPPEHTASAVAPNPSDELENRRVAAAAYLTMGDPDGAVTMIEVAGPALRDSPAALLDLGNAYEALEDDNAAGNAYRRLLQLQPVSVEGLLGLSRTAARQKNWRAALPAAAQARLLAPRDPRPVYQLALVLQTSPHPPSLIPQSSALSPLELLRSLQDYGPAQLQLGLWCLRHSRPDVAAGYLEQAVAASAARDDTHLRLAEALEAIGRKADAAYQRGRYDELCRQLPQAVREYERLAQLAPERKDVPLLLSAVYSQMGQNARAVAAAESGCRQFPDDLSLRARFGQLLLTDQRPRAAALCERWSKERPRWGEPYRLLARMEREALHPAEAAKLAAKARALEPQNPEYCLEAAQAFLALARPDALHRAVAALQQGLALDPGSAAMHLRLGEALERLGDLDGARLHYLRSMDNERNVRFGVYALSQLCPRLRQPARARFYAENTRALREREDAVTPLWRRVYQNPNDADAHTQLTDWLLRAGDLQPALHQLDQALRLHPDARRQRQRQMLQRLLEMRQE